MPHVSENMIRLSDDAILWTATSNTHRIARGRCAVSICREDRNRHDWMDHVAGWIRDGKPSVLVAQPYALSSTDRADLVRIGEEWNLDVQIGDTGWYGHDTTFVQPWTR